MRLTQTVGAASAALALALVAPGAAPAAQAAAQGPPAPVPLRTGWELHRDGLALTPAAAAVGTAGWVPTTVPGVIDPQPLLREWHQRGPTGNAKAGDEKRKAGR